MPFCGLKGINIKTIEIVDRVDMIDSVHMVDRLVTIDYSYRQVSH